MERIRYFLAPPVFAGAEEKTRNARLLNAITVSLFLGALVYGLIVPAERVLYTALVFGVTLVVWLVMRSGRIRAASITLVIGVFLIISIAALTGGGIQAPEYGAFILPILFAGLLLGWQITLVTATCAILFGAVLIGYESFSFLPEPVVYEPEIFWLINSTYFILASVFLTLALRMINDALHGSVRELGERKHVENELLQFKNVMDESSDAIYLIDTNDGHYIDFNKSAYEWLGYTREELARINVMDVAQHIPNLGVWHERVELVREKGKLIFETVYREKSGALFPVEVSARMLDYGDTKVILGIVRDISERNRSEAALRESEERFRKVFQSSPVAICITTLEEGRLLDANYAYWELSGYDAKTSIGKDYLELKMWAKPSGRGQFVEKIKQKRSMYDPDYEFKDTQGHLKSAIAFYELIRVGEEDCLLSMFYDMSAQKATMQALRQSEARTRALLEAIPDLIFEFSADGIFLKSFQPPLGSLLIPPAEFIGRNVREVMPGDIAEKTIRAIQGAIHSGKLEAFEYRLQMPDGLREYEARMIASAGDSALAIVRDITQQKWAETEREKIIDELEQKNRESETLREGLVSVVATFDLEQIVERILDQIKLVIPYDTASVWQVEGEWQTLLVSRDLPPTISLSDLRFRVDQDNSSRPILHGEKPYVLNNNVQEELGDFKGPHSYVNSWLAVPLKTRGQIIGLIALDGKSKNQFKEHHADLAATFANQVAIALENARLFEDLQDKLKKEIALRSAAMAISSSLHVDQVLSEICKQMCVILDGTSAYIAQYDGTYSSYTIVAEYTGENANSLEQASDLGITYYKQDGARFIDETEELDYEIIHSDNEKLSPWLKNTLSQFGGNSILYIPLYVQGHLLGHAELWDSRNKREFTRDEISFCRTLCQQAAIAIANANLFEQLQNELTERKNLIAELESKNAELERFTYTVSHDLKSPLFTIRGFLGYLEQDALGGKHERVKSDVQRITDATEKMQILLNDLLELSRIGRLKNESVAVPLVELAREAVELVQGRILERGVSVHIDSNLPVVLGDRQRLLEVLQNLIDNAAKFMGHQKEPRVEIGQSGESVGRDMPTFYVRDNGIGIASDHFERVFGLFNKLDAKSEGTGIGLALVKRILEVHGGRIWVESEAGQGTTFYFTLPLAGS